MSTQRTEPARRDPVTVLGLGPMGRSLASAFLSAGHPTTVWNRSPDKADGLVANGAVRADTVADAVAASPVVVICVLDHMAVRSIVAPVADRLRGRTLVNLSSGTPERARAFAVWAAEHSVDYLDGAIMTPVESIGTASAVVLYSGHPAVHDRHGATLASLGGTSSYLGTDPGRAAAHELALLDLFWTAMHGVVHAFSLARAEGITARDLAPLAQGIANLLPEIIAGYAGEIDDGRPTEDAAIASAEVAMGHIVDVGRSHGLDVSVLAAAKAAARRAVDAGYGADGFSRLIEALDGAPAG